MNSTRLLVTSLRLSARLPTHIASRIPRQYPGLAPRVVFVPVSARSFSATRLNKDWQAPTVTYEQLKPRTQNPTGDLYLIDVRETDEVVQGSIPSSVSLPLSTMPGSLKLHPAEFQKRFGFTMPEENTEMIMYCRSGKRSATACDLFAKNGFKNVKNYEGSWLDWVEKEKGSQ